MSSIREATLEPSEEDSETFHPFRDLPLDVRQRIWKYHISTTCRRFVPVWLKTWKRGTEGLQEECQPSERKYLSKVPPPAVLHICHDTRKLALEKYSLQFRGAAQKCPIYINPVVDVVYLSGEHLYNEPALFGIRHLAIPLVSARVRGPGLTTRDLDAGFFHAMRRVHLFRRLMTLTFLIHDGPCRFCSEKKFSASEMITAQRYDSTLLDGFDGAILQKLQIPYLPLQRVKASHPEWSMPRVSIMVLVRDGQICCGFGQDD